MDWFYFYINLTLYSYLAIKYVLRILNQFRNFIQKQQEFSLHDKNNNATSAVTGISPQTTVLKYKLIIKKNNSALYDYKLFKYCVWRLNGFWPQIREQMSGLEISYYGKSILGCGQWSGLWAVVWAGLWNKRVWANHEQLLGPVFSFFRGQNIFWFFFENTLASALKSCIK